MVDNEDVHSFLKHTSSPTTSTPTTNAPTTSPTTSPTTTSPTTSAPTKSPTSAPTPEPNELIFPQGFDGGFHGLGSSGVFETTVKSAIATALGVSQAEVTIVSVVDGSVKVSFRVASVTVLTEQQSVSIVNRIRDDFGESNDATLNNMAKDAITVSGSGTTPLVFTRAPTGTEPTPSPTTRSPTTKSPTTSRPTATGETYAPTAPPTDPPTNSPTRPPTPPPPPPVNIYQTTAEEQCTVTDFTKIMLAVASTLCSLVAFMAITFWYILERGRGGSGFRIAPGAAQFAAVGKPIGHSLFKKARGTPEETQGLVNRRGDV